MRSTELQKLIREEVKKALSEADFPRVTNINNINKAKKAVQAVKAILGPNVIPRSEEKYLIDQFTSYLETSE